MAKAPLLDIDALLGEVPGEFADGVKGAGDPNLYDDTLRDQLNILREEVPPGTVDSLGQPKETKKAEWKKVEEQSREALAKKSKDLRIAAYLIEALVRQNGFAGVRDGFILMRRLCEICWDRLYPVVEDGDPMSRFEPVLNMIDDPDRGLALPTTLRKLPLIKGGAKGNFGVFEHELSQNPQRPEAKQADAINQAILATPFEYIDEELNAIVASHAEREKLVNLLKPKMGNTGPPPGFLQVREALVKCQALADLISKKVAPARPEPAAQEDKGTDAKTGAASAKPAVPTRADIYRQLQALATQLQSMEPHSPIPYLIQRCVNLGNLPFPDMIKELVREDKVLAEMKRELGIKDAAPPKK
jgi:type VI secretion system protein ImpA